ncbi:MAG: chromophore lyase CpcT/CpeT [Candidatus Sericytochromatia bacterium]|nr:chromophore lyase CpcT/CpeT [Candidatus Sericytochromatia bacterium]
MMMHLSSTMTRGLALGLSVLALAACSKVASPTSRVAGVASAQAVVKRAKLEQLANKMIGVYDSKDQAQADPENYRDVTLHMVRVWPERTDGPWLYIEQALSNQVALPYRQRVYKLSARADGRVASEILTLPEPALQYAGAWRSGQPLGQLKPEDLTPRTGCAVILREALPGVWAGSTVDRECPSELYGATYATSIVKVTSRTLESWDRGYDANGEQVWGADKGGYVFIKRSVR